MNQHRHELAAHHPWLRRLARRLARSPSRAEDLVQETCVTALRHLPPDVRLRPWLRAVMRKLAWGQVRSERRRAEREEGFARVTPSFSPPDPLLEYGIDRARLAEALELLAEPFRSTLLQRFVEGRSCADIARQERVPAGTVRWRQSRALELLRAQLDARPGVVRRSRVIWALPFLGTARLVASMGQSLATWLSSGKAAWWWLACASVAFILGIPERAPRVAASEAMVVRRSHVEERPHPPAAPADQPDESAAATIVAAAAEPVLESIEASPPGDPAPVEEGTVVPELARAQRFEAEAASPSMGGLLTAALLTPRRTVPELANRSGGGGDAPIRRPETRPDDPPAESETDERCTSELAESGLLCSTCTRAGQQRSECLPAECGTVDHCLRCVDPKGRVGVDCSVDYELLAAGSFGTSAGDSFSLSACSFTWGVPQVSGTTCHFPGVQSCAVTSGPEWQCLECQYPNGALTQICSGTEELLPDPLLGRPDDLPAPGRCTTELGPDGSIACATCTRDDLSATISCRYRGMASCDWGFSDPAYPSCMGQCEREDGTRVLMCNSGRGPRPLVFSANTSAPGGT